MRRWGLTSRAIFFCMSLVLTTVGLMTVVPNGHEYQGALDERVVFNAFVALFVVVAMSGVTLWLVHRALAPISDLNKVTADIAAGDLSRRARESGPWEIVELAKSFNRMADRLQTSYALFEQTVHERTLELAERTRELELENTERRAAEDGMLQAKELAEAANRAKSDFLANMSHELRTPMNSILGFADLLMRGVDGGNEAERRDWLGTIRHSGQHLLALINDILDLSKIEAGRMEMEKLPCSPNELVAEVVSILRPRAEEKAVTLDVKFQTVMPATIEIDPVRFRQLLTNVVANALKFTEHGSVQIAVGVAPVETGYELDLLVVDTGIGIPTDRQQAVFEAFAQADNSVTRKYGGTGLGLAITRRIVEAMQGTISLRSEVGKGTTFVIRLPLGSLEGVPMGPVGDSEALRGSSQPEPIDDATPIRGRILLVEDGEPNRKLITLILRRAGLEVETAENGQVGVEMVKSGVFDLILMDMQMPVMDGYTAARILRSMGVTVPILALTANAMRGDAEKCAAAGCSGYLSKPVNVKRLLATVQRELSASPRASNQGAGAGGTVPAPNCLVSTLDTNDSELRRIIEVFVAELPARIDRIRDAADAGAIEVLGRLTQGLGSAGCGAGFPAIGDAANGIEITLREERFAELRSAVARLAEVAEGVRRSIPPQKDGSCLEEVMEGRR